MRLVGSISLLIVLCASARADHNVDHRVLFVGVPSKLIIALPACDTEEQIMEIVSAYIDGGPGASYTTMLALHKEENDRGEPICGLVSGRIMVRKVLGRYELNGDPSITVMRIGLLFRDEYREFYAMVNRVEVLEKRWGV